ncbi:ABC-type Fe3+/spermidine/putrescine transport system ATPase subunit [Pedobacter africanus]|uniref:ABC-type Fe3+/spermidine/putrescine transport system ATPase subunit n=1 Tax=Pedobacter africanus TaxID=151894 RepID=A0ACC6L574_9SPHI|nr:ABC transporter ATP-binding protein [Pedobacter africanus]MDR6786585.1 ABC-type Fe3+/spermidine/putrescine transport system ATPase subunit [Pedobacter africanus]
MEEPIISVKNLSKQYQAEQQGGISDISFNIKKGNVIAILGESGSGKSTLLKCIYGLLKADAGEVLFNGKRILGPDEQLIPGHKEMKMVTQDFSLNIYAKVYDNIASMLSNTNVKAKQEKTTEMMQHLHIAQLKDKKITQLSGGEQQRVAIAQAMVSDTAVLLLDEPFSQVDALLKNQLRADIKRIAAETGVTVVMVSHDPADGLFLADELLILKDGKLLQHGKPANVYQHPDHIYTAQLLGNAVVLGHEEAEKLGLEIKNGHAVFYPEWVELKSSWNSRRFEVKDIYYKGFYEELLLERNGVKIRAIQLNRGEHKKHDHIQANISRFITFVS